MTGIGIKENETQLLNVSVYPNPASNLLFIEFKERQGNTTIEIFDVAGKIVKAGAFLNSQKYTGIPVADLAKGLYLVRIRTGAGSVTKKFIKE